LSISSQGKFVKGRVEKIGKEKEFSTRRELKIVFISPALAGLRTAACGIKK